MTWTFSGRVVIGTVLAAMAMTATATATAPLSRAACDDGTVGDERCLSECPEGQSIDADSGDCRAKTNQSAPLKQAWEDLFGPLPSPEDFALARVEDPTVEVGLPGVGLPGVGVGGVTIALPAAGAGVATGAALPSVGLPAAPSLPEVGLPAIGPPALPGPPGLPFCTGFATGLPIVGFSTC